MSNPVDDFLAEEAPTQTVASNQQAMSGSGNPVDDFLSEPALDQSTATVKQQMAKGAGTPDSPLQGVVQFSEMLNKARSVGQSGFRDSALGHEVMLGRMTLEDALGKIDADEELAQKSEDLKQYEKDSAIPWLTSIALSTAKQLPMVEASLGVGAVGFGVGGGATAVTGVGAPVAIPVGLMTGTATTAAWTADYIKGQEYLERRRKGMDHESAKTASTISGLAQGMLAGVQLGQAAKLPVSAAKNILAAHAQSLGHFLLDAVKFEGSQIALAEAQTTAKLVTDAIAGTVAKVPNVVPTMEQAAQEWGNTFQETLKGSIGMFVGGKAIGSISGHLLKRVLQKTHDTHMKNQQAKLDAIKESETKAQEADAAKNPEAAAAKEQSKNAQEKAERARVRLEKRIASENEIRRIFEAAKSRFYIAADESRLAEVGRVQRLLKRMVKNSDLLDDKTKAKLLARTIDINGIKVLLKEGDKFIEETWGNEHANAVKEAKAKLDAAIKSGQQKGQKATLPQAAQASLKWYQEFFTEPKIERKKGDPKRESGETARLSREAALQKARDFLEHGFEEEKKKLNAQVEKLQADELSEIFNQPAELEEKQRIAMEAASYFSGQLDPAGVVRLAEQIETIVKTGKSEFLERKQAEGQRLLALRKRVMDGVQGVKPVVPSADPKPARQLTGVGKVLNSVRRTSTSLWDKLLQDTPVEDRQKIISEILDFTEVENKESAINIRAAEKLSELYSNAVGNMKEATRLIRDGADPKKRLEIRYTDTEGRSVVEHHTLNELTYLSMAMDDPGAVPGLIHGNKYTLKDMTEPGSMSTQEAVKSLLERHEDGKYLKLAGAVKDFYRWFAPQVSNHYLKEKGVALPTDPNYSGAIHHRQLERIKSAGDLMQDVNNFASRSVDPGSIKARSNSKMPIMMTDPFNQVQKHRADMAFWMANSQKARELSFIFSDSTKDGLRDVIAHKLGSEFKGLVDGRLAWQFHLKPGIMDVGDQVFQGIKSNMATGLLGARIDQAPKQWTSILAALSTSTPKEFADGLLGAMNKEKLNGYISRSELYQDRQSHILPQILEATQDRSFADAVTGDRALAVKTFFLIPMHKWGDGVGAAVAGFVEYNRVLKSGGTIEQAVLAGDRLVDSTQSSSRPSQKVPAEWKGGIANLSLAFQKEGIQAMNRESGAIRDWFIHRDDKHLARMVRTMASIHIAQTLFQTLNCAPGILFGDDKEKEQAGLRVLSAGIGGAYSQVPLIGVDIVQGAVSGFKDESSPHTVVAGLAGDAMKLLKRSWTIARKGVEGEEIEGEEWMKEFKSMAGVASAHTGIPFWGLFKYYELSDKVAKKATGQE